MGNFLFFALICVVGLGMGRVFWRGIQTMRAALSFEAELRVHWRQIYPSGKEWDYFWRWRNWRKILSSGFLSQYPDLQSALEKFEQKTGVFGRELLYFLFLTPAALGLIFVITLLIETSNR